MTPALCGEEGREKESSVLQGVFMRIYECLLEDGVVRPEQIACPPHLPTAQQMQLVRPALAPTL